VAAVAAIAIAYSNYQNGFRICEHSPLSQLPPQFEVSLHFGEAAAYPKAKQSKAKRRR